MDDAQFLHQFESGTLHPFPHRDHVRMAWIYLRRDGWTHGYDLIRLGIQRFAAHHGVIKYHETITRFWAHLIQAAIRAAPEVDDFEVFAAANPTLFDKSIIEQFYSHDLLMSEEARYNWIEPDLQDLPQ